MVRIGGGVFPDIKEPDYLGERGYTIDDKAGKVEPLLVVSSPAMLLEMAFSCFAGLQQQAFHKSVDKSPWAPTGFVRPL